MNHGREAYYTACYCKAVAFQRMGRTRAAIRYFTDALVCDDGCETTYWQLYFLTQIQDARNAMRKAEAEKSQQQRERVKKAEEKKMRRKVAKDARKKAKTARGPGYVLGSGFN